MAGYKTWAPYEGASRITLAVVLLAIAAGVVYAGIRLRRPVQPRQPGRTATYIMLTVWAIAIVAFLGDLAVIVQDFQRAGQVYKTPPDPIAPVTFSAVVVVFVIIAIFGPQEWPGRLQGATFGALAAPMIFEVPFDLIIVTRIQLLDPAQRVLFFAPLFVVEFMTLALLTLSPMVRLTRVTFFTFAAMLVVFAVWALAGFGYPATHTYYTCNVISKILAFVTTLTLFRPRAAWAGARLRLRSGRPA
jgi:hypothetical protein